MFILMVILFFTLPTICSADETVSYESLSELTASNNEYLEQVEDRKMWYKQLSQNGERIGYNHGFAFMIDQQTKDILKNEEQWDTILSFDTLVSLNTDKASNGLYLIGGIVDTFDAQTHNINKKITTSTDDSYFLRQQPYTALSPPHWKDYLFLDQPIDLDLPSDSFRPRTKHEKAIWRDAVEKGWKLAQEDAIIEMRNRWRSLLYDLRGMVRYWTLVESNQINDVKTSIIQEPVVHSTNDKGQEILSLNKMTYRIDNDASFNKNFKNWDLVVTQDQTNVREQLKADIINGRRNIEDLTEAEKVIVTETYKRNNPELLNLRPELLSDTDVRLSDGY